MLLLMFHRIIPYAERKYLDLDMIS